LYIQGPTCTKNGGGKKLKKIVDEMAAPFGVLHTCTAERETGTERARETDRQSERDRETETETFCPLSLPLFSSSFQDWGVVMKQVSKRQREREYSKRVSKEEIGCNC
jgi:hypothetical protein